MNPWEKYGGAPEAEGPWAKYAAAPKAEPTNPAAANPEAEVSIPAPLRAIANIFSPVNALMPSPSATVKGEVGETAMFNPAAALIKSGDLFSRLSRGAIEAKEFIPSLLRGQPTEAMQKVRAEREFASQPMKELEAVHPGSAQIGEVATLAAVPPALLPALGALEEGSVEDRAKRAGAALAGNKLVKTAGGYLAKAPERAAAAQEANAIRDALVAEGKKEGLVFPPSAQGGGIVSRTLEGISGKAKTEQALTLRNQPVADRIAQEELGAANLKPATLQAIRDNAYATGYKPIADMPQVVGDTQLLNGLKNLAPNATGGAIKSPARGEIDDMVGAIAQQGKWTGAQLIDDIQALREGARANFGAAKVAGGSAAKTDLAKAQIKAADLLENLAERNVIAAGGKTGTVKALRDARTAIAKSYSVEDSLVNGSVNVKDLKGALSGRLKMLSDLADDKALGKSMAMPVAGANVPVTVLDAFGLAGLAALDGGALSLIPAASRVTAARAVTNPAVQKFIRPDYSPSLLSRGAPALNNRYSPALAGMFGLSLADRY